MASMYIFGAGYAAQPQRDDPAARAAADRAKSKADDVETRLDRAMLTMEAIWTLVRERTGLADADLLQRIADLDATDGMLDGKVRRPPIKCPHCDRTTPNRFDRCMYCGGDVPRDPFA